MKSGIYTITNLVNGKIYVGCSSNLFIRKKEHINNLLINKHPNIYLQDSFNKYGKDNFLFEILEICDKQFLISQEHYWCTILNTHNRNYGYNIAPTCPTNILITNRKLSIKEKNHLSKINKGKTVSNETKEKISKSLKGIKRSIESIIKSKEARKGIKRNNESKLKMSQSKKGKVFSELHKQQISLSKKGKPAHNKGKVMSEEQKLKISNSMKKHFINGNQI